MSEQNNTEKKTPFYKKKWFIAIVAIVVIVAIFNPGNDDKAEPKDVAVEDKEETKDSDKKDDKNTTEEDEVKSESQTKTNFGADEEWIVDGLFKLTVHSVTPTDERNQFSDKKPQQVVKVTYSYENIGYKGEIQDLFITPENLIDGEGEMAETYPVDTKPAQPTPIGAKMKNAQEAFGLNNESEEVTVNFSVYGNDFDEYSATFKIPVK